MSKVLTKKKYVLTVGFLSFALVVIICLFSLVGSPFISPADLFNKTLDPVFSEIFFSARLPRVVLAALVGMALSSSGVTFQALLRNPLADPYILGVSGGAALGGIIGLMLQVNFPVVTMMSFLSGLGSLFLIYSLAQVDKSLPAHTLLLTGVIFNSFSFALILFINSVVQMGEAHQIFFMLVGSVDAYPWTTLAWMGALVIGCMLVLMWLSSQINLISLGENEARSLGCDVDRLRKILFVVCSLVVGASVSLTGLIGFVGLFVPHMVRLIWGQDYRLLIPASCLGGGIFLVACDALSRTLLAGEMYQTQLPLGVITAMLGAPFFVFLLRKSRHA